METLEVKKKKSSADKIWRISPVQYYLEKGMCAFSDMLPDDSFWFKNYIIDINEFFIGGAVKNEPTIKLVQFSDLHLKTISTKLKKTVAKVNALKPDLILFTGDAVDDNAYLPELENLLGLFDKEIQKVAIKGNWEIAGCIDMERMQKLYEAHNCILLVNDTQQFTFGDKTVSITGADDYCYGLADYQLAVKNYKQSDYHIVLTHCPGHRDVISTQLTPQVPVDFVVSGHTHGGQLNFFGLTPELPVGSGKYLSGWYNHIEPPLYVSKGLGTSILPVRIGSTAEISVFHLKA